MDLLTLIIFFIIGTCMGSFYTVVGYRLPKKENWTTSNSHCDNCNHKLSLLDMIPIISFIFLKGKCRYCHKKIDSLSTFMELFTGILYATAYYSFGLSYELLFAIGIITLLMIVVISDIKYLTIPDELLVAVGLYFIILSLVAYGLIPTIKSMLSGIFLFALMFVVMLLGNIVFKKESLGGGDVKMMFIFGFLLGPLVGSFSIFIASILALPISFILLKKSKESIIPFGPFLLISLTLLYFTHIDTNTILQLLTL